MPVEYLKELANNLSDDQGPNGGWSKALTSNLIGRLSLYTVASESVKEAVSGVDMAEFEDDMPDAYLLYQSVIILLAERISACSAEIDRRIPT